MPSCSCLPQLKGVRVGVSDEATRRGIVGAQSPCVKPVSREESEWAIKKRGGRGVMHSWALGAGRARNEPFFGDDQSGISCPGDREHGLGGLVSDSEYLFITGNFA